MKLEVYDSDVKEIAGVDISSVPRGTRMVMPPESLENEPGVLIDRYRRWDCTGIEVALRLWWLVVGFGIAPSIRLICRCYGKRRGVTPGTCKMCGYDLRATPDRCPECGTAIEEWRGEARHALALDRARDA